MRTRVMVTGAVGLMVLAGCTGESAGDASGSTTTSAAGQTASSSAAASGDDATPEQGQGSGDGAAGPALGERFEYDDGLAVSVTAPELFMPSATATMGPEPDYISVTVTVVNGTENDFSPLDVTVTVASGGGQGGDVLDPDSGIGAPDAAIAPGQEASWKLAFGVLDGQDVTVNVQPGIDRDPVIFGG